MNFLHSHRHTHIINALRKYVKVFNFAMYSNIKHQLTETPEFLVESANSAQFDRPFYNNAFNKQLSSSILAWFKHLNTPNTFTNLAQKHRLYTIYILNNLMLSVISVAFFFQFLLNHLFFYSLDLHFLVLSACFFINFGSLLI